jgi:hypothetical protein
MFERAKVRSYISSGRGLQPIAARGVTRSLRTIFSERSRMRLPGHAPYAIEIVRTIFYALRILFKSPMKIASLTSVTCKPLSSAIVRLISFCAK